MTEKDVADLKRNLPEFERLVETHISWVFLCRQYAYKFKKPLKLHFLDFSTFEMRFEACYKEISLNRRLEPELYLGMVIIVDGPRGVEVRDIGAEGRAKDYGLKMKRLDTELELDNRLKSNQVSLEYMDKLAEKVADFHSNAEVISQTSPYHKAYLEDFNDLFSLSSSLEEIAGIEAAELRALREISDRFLQHSEALLSQRAAAGLIRDLHGDLHTGNIFAYPQPIIFDCIEFNDHFRQVDVLSEVAFLLMDLEALGKHAHAEHFLRSYLAFFPEAKIGSGWAHLLLWFKAYRANIRAKVNALRHAQQGSETTRNAVVLYLDLMAKYLRKLPAEG